MYATGGDGSGRDTLDLVMIVNISQRGPRPQPAHADQVLEGPAPPATATEPCGAGDVIPFQRSIAKPLELFVTQLHHQTGMGTSLDLTRS